MGDYVPIYGQHKSRYLPRPLHSHCVHMEWECRPATVRRQYEPLLHFPK